MPNTDGDGAAGRVPLLGAAIRVCVASRNPAKGEAVRRGLRPFFEDLLIEAVSVDSGVSPQPIGFEEIVEGARNRARRGFLSGGRGDCDLSVGIEDGLVAVPGIETGYMNLGCAVLFDGETESVGLTAGFEYPRPCVAAATGTERTPIGDAFDAIYVAPPGIPDPGPGAGNIGRLSMGVLTRADYGAQAVVCAMVRRLHPKMFAGGSP